METRGRRRWTVALIVACVVAATGVVVDLLVADIIWRVAVISGGVGSALVAVRHNNVRPLFAVMLTVAVVRLVVVDTGDMTFTVRDGTWSQAAGDLVAGPLLIVALALVLRQRRGRFGWREVGDAGSVLLGSALVAWISVANPAWVDGVELPLAIAGGMYLPIAFLLVHFSVELMLDGLTRNRAMRFLLAGSLANLVATVVRSGIGPSGDAEFQIRIVVAMFAVSLLLGCAALSHIDAPAIFRHHEQVSIHPPSEALRLLPFALSLIAVGYLGSTVVATSRTDEVVQSAFVAAITVAVLGRLYVALSTSFHAQARLLDRLNTDEMTGLPNRHRLVQLVDDSLDTHWGASLQPTLVQLNIDRFKNLNDTLGHATANELLIQVAERIRIAAAGFGGIVARTGGDEFVIVDTAVDESDVLVRVETIRAALDQPLAIDGASIFVTASIGVAIAPAARTIDADELIRRANIATHQAKHDGRNRAVLFDESMQSNLARRMEVEHALHAALELHQLLLFHQPIIDINTGRLTGFEALIRWRRDDGTLVSPADFIPIAEETGMIVELGAWALRAALGDLRRWIDDGLVPPTTSVSVNVSPRQIADPDFSEVVVRALADSGIPPHQLWLEMTESMMLQEPELAESTLRRIRASGVRLALDDFGTGYSSLSLLQRFPIQRLKIDRMFVQGIADRSSDRSLVRTIIALAQSMGLDLVAEGVETVEQMGTLREMGCGRAQGYLISRPVPVEAIRTTVEAIAELSRLPLFDDAAAHLGSEHWAAVDHHVAGASRPIGSFASMPLA